MSQQPYDYFYIKDLSGGLNLADSPLKIGDNQLVVAMNAIIDGDGNLSRRGGYAKAVSVAISEDLTDVIGIDNVTRYYFGASAYYVVSATAPTQKRICYWNGTNWIELTGGTALTSTAHVQFMQFCSSLFIFNGTQFEYTDATLFAANTKADCVFNPAGGYTSFVPSIMEVCDGRLFGSDGTKIYYSEVDGWTTDPGTDLNFLTNDNFTLPYGTAVSGGVRALVRHGNTDELLVGRGSDLGVLLGLDTYDYRMMQMDAVAGIVSPAGAAETDNGMLAFVGNNQVYVLAGQTIEPIGRYIVPAINGVNMTASTCVYDIVNDMVIIGYPEGSIVLFPRFNAWTQWDIPFTCAVRCEAVTDFNRIVFGLAGSTYLYEMNNGKSDDGSNIYFKAQTKTLDLSRFADKKKIHSIKLLLKAETETPCTVTAILNDGEKYDQKDVLVQLTGFMLSVDKLSEAVLGGDNVTQGAAMMAGDLSKFNEISIIVESNNQYDLTIHQIAIEGKFEPKVREEPE